MKNLRDLNNKDKVTTPKSIEAFFEEKLKIANKNIENLMPHIKDFNFNIKQ